LKRLRVVSVAMPTEINTRGGLAYALWLPERTPPRGAVVILHGAGSCKESHYDYARVLLAAGFASVAFDQRGHGDSDGPMDGRALDDVTTIASLLRAATGGAPLALRGSSMGGYLALAAAPVTNAQAVIAICPASATGLRRALRSDERRFDADAEAVDALLGAHDLYELAGSLQIPVLLLHAEGDEVVPVEHSRELAALLGDPASRLIAVPGGHHRSVQHDLELQAISVKFLTRALPIGA
jgi:alpha-beta hydrolase superfamily lysophospholipase